MRIVSIILLVIVSIVTQCGITPPVIDSTMLDSPEVNDTSFVDPTFRVSSDPQNSSFDWDKPVIICVHGYSACTFEWEEFRDFALQDSRVYTSLVLMGGHGRDYEDFKEATWKEWQTSIMTEYDSLVALGFKHISFAVSSTSCALLIDYLSRNSFSAKTVQPEHILMVDPIVISGNKTLTLIPAVGPVLGNVPTGSETEIEKRHWYQNRPAESLEQLNSCIITVQKELEKGVKVPLHCTMKVFKSSGDKVADPVSALLIYKGMSNNDGSKIDVEMVDSDIHVFTRLHGRKSYSQKDKDLQQRVYKEIIDKSVE